MSRPPRLPRAERGGVKRGGVKRGESYHPVSKGTGWKAYPTAVCGPPSVAGIASPPAAARNDRSLTGWKACPTVKLVENVGDLVCRRDLFAVSRLPSAVRRLFCSGASSPTATRNDRKVGVT